MEGPNRWPYLVERRQLGRRIARVPGVAAHGSPEQLLLSSLNKNGTENPQRKTHNELRTLVSQLRSLSSAAQICACAEKSPATSSAVLIPSFNERASVGSIVVQCCLMSLSGRAEFVLAQRIISAFTSECARQEKSPRLNKKSLRLARQKTFKLCTDV
eukprot:704616-Prorocentrum_minimum.AAC.2